MTNKNDCSYRFGIFLLDTRQSLLLRDGDPVKLPAKTFEMLRFFIQNANQVVDKETLMLELWKDSYVEEANLAVHISNLRKILNGNINSNGQSSIETFPKVGYRFNADVGLENNDNLPPPDGIDNLVNEIAPEKDVSEISAPPVPRSRLRMIVVFSAVGAVLIAVILFVGSSYFSDKRITAFRDLNVVRFTNLGTARHPAAAPDGKTVVYAREENGGFSLWLKVIGSTSETQILTPTKGTLFDVSFLPDGKSLTYGAQLGDQPPATYVMPLLGGSSNKLALKASKVTFSPDGSRLVFQRSDFDGKTFVMAANADGSDPRVVTTRQAPNYYWTAIPPSWSPDGKRVACVAQNANESTPRIVEIDVSAETEKSITNHSWTALRGVSWVPDGRGMLVVGSDENTSIRQVWYVSYPDGVATRITNDTTSYEGVSTSSDGRIIATTEVNNPATIWVAPASMSLPGSTPEVDIPRAVQIGSSRVDGGDGYAAISWAPEGKIVFSSEESGNGDIWTMNADGSERRQLTTDRHSDSGPTVSADGKKIAFMSTRSGMDSLWIMDIDGGDQRRVTNKMIEISPTFSPDGRFLYFTGWETGKATTWMIAVEGGDTTQVVDEVSFNPTVSSDGRLLLYSGTEGIVVKEIESGKKIRTYKLPAYSCQWVPNKRGFSYLDWVNGIPNLWFQSLESETPVQLTNYTTDGILAYGWSRDGTKIAFSRGTSTSDIVVMSRSD